MMKALAGGMLAALLLLTACDTGDARTDVTRSLEAEEMGAAGGADFITVSASQRSRDEFASPAPAPVPDSAPVDTPADTVTERLIAYRYGYQMETPADRTEALLERHRAACLDAGPATCQVVNANIYQQGSRGPAGTLALRAIPAWVDTFRDGLDGELDTAGGRLLNQSQSAEDLTSAIYDAEARLDAQRTLRTRLAALLERDGASVEELVQVERELARVQGDIEAAEARIRVMRGRVSMSRLDLNYSSTVDPVSRSAFDPLGRALRNLAGTFASGLAGVITFIAAALPWLIVIVPVFWLLGRWLRSLWRKREQKKTAG